MDPVFLKLMIDAGATGVLVWLILHVFRVLLPQKDAAFAQAIENMATRFHGQLTAQRQEFRDDLAANRADFLKALERFQPPKPDDQ